MYFDVISRSHAHTSISHILALFWKVTTVLEVRNAYNRKIHSKEEVNVPGFNKLVHFKRFEKCKILKFSRGACPWTPLDEARTFSACSANKLIL